MIINQIIIDEIFAQARNEAPLEACGYLAGKDGEVVKRYFMTNIDQSPEHFSFDPKEQFAVSKAVRAESLALLAVYHSHPETPARPSAEDIALAYDPLMIYVIASLLDNNIKAFRIVNGIVTEEKLEILKSE